MIPCRAWKCDCPSKKRRECSITGFSLLRYSCCLRLQTSHTTFCHFSHNYGILAVQTPLWLFQNEAWPCLKSLLYAFFSEGNLQQTETFFFFIIAQSGRSCGPRCFVKVESETNTVSFSARQFGFLSPWQMANIPPLLFLFTAWPLHWSSESNHCNA